MQGGKVMSMVKLKLKRHVPLFHRVQPKLNGSVQEDGCIPNDVKEGHFAVLAGNQQGAKRFVVGLQHLKNPRFLRLLDKAYDEFGFKHQGLLVVPCSPHELQKILVEGM